MRKVNHKEHPSNHIQLMINSVIKRKNQEQNPPKSV